MTPEQIAEGRRLLDEVKSGPWKTLPLERNPALTAIAIPGSMHPVANPADAELIVWSRNNLPELLNSLTECHTRIVNLEQGREIERHALRNAIAQLARVRELAEDGECWGGADAIEEFVRRLNEILDGDA